MHEHEEERDDNGDDASDGGNGDGELMKCEVMALEERSLLYFLVLKGRVAHGINHVGQVEEQRSCR